MARRLVLPLLAMALCVGMVAFAAYDRNGALIIPQEGALWIRYPQPVDLKAHPVEKLISTFRVKFEVEGLFTEATLTVCAVGSPTVWLDGKAISDAPEGSSERKNRTLIDLKPMLGTGVHTLVIQVERADGYPLLLAFCKSVNLFSDETWEVNNDGTNWTKAWSATRSPSADLSLLFTRADRAWFSLWWFFVPVFVLVLMWTRISSNGEDTNLLQRHRPTANQIRWLLIVLWALLAINNIGKLPLDLGMDARDHYAYILYVAEQKSIPSASDGWQMFQPPLFYIVCALIYGALETVLSPMSLAMSFRAVNLLCGLIQVELCYRALREVYPRRDDLQAIGTIVGGLLPMNIYMSQVIGNEPLAACLSGTAVLIGVRLFTKRTVPTKRSVAILGAVIGLAVLTKPTAFLLILPLVICLSYAVFAHNKLTVRSISVLSQLVLVMLAAVALVSGWYYVRNFILMGRFFVGGWDSAGFTAWWQYPSYRTLQQLTCFGECLIHPIYSSVHGVWDSLYSTLWADAGLSGNANYRAAPPWNYALMFSLLWFSILPSVAITIGILAGLTAREDSIRRRFFFPAISVLVYVMAVFYLYLQLPIYSTAKATYTLGLTPCYAILAAAGLNVMMRGRWSRAIVTGLLTCWAVSAYAAFFI